MKYATKLAEQLHISVRLNELKKRNEEIYERNKRYQKKFESNLMEILSLQERAAELEKEIQEENQQEY